MADTAGAAPALVKAAELERFATAVMEAVGLPGADARTVAWALVTANLEGIDTHGVSRLALYARRVRAGLAAARPRLRWSHPAPAVALLDADNALGPVAAVAAMDEAVRLARSQGSGMVAVAHTNHAAALSAYVERATEADCLALMVCNTPPAMPPWGGRRAFLGTNPLAFAAPGAVPGEPPVVIDMATTVVARGNIIMAARKGRAIPEGWAVDAEGCSTTDAQAALAGAVLPMAGPKGYALALMIEILSAIVPGSSWGPHVRSPYEDWTRPTDAGLWCLALSLPALMPLEIYQQRLGGLLGALQQEPAAPGEEIRIPGARRAATRAQRLAQGIPLDSATHAELAALSAELGVRPPVWSTP
ncbi:Ldh family oxidoreductase [Thermogemmatispora onikobensis]|uniref:Ldh family oxidoreductase n=1 Tax=Thermogemmatispora onikobensis TaxID=732234 RepID=UPI0008536EB0|nr:Ldh family oxidoreductase [Thermogemmatispora onikobensis]